MVYRIPEAKPHLKGGGSPVDVSEEKPALAYDASSDIIMFSEESWLTITLSWLKTSLMFLLSAMAIFTVVYATLAASLLFATPVEGKVTVVARDTFLGGIPAKEDVVLASPSQAAGKDPLDRLKNAAFGVPGAEIVKVLSAPNDTVHIDGDNVVVTGMESGSYSAPVLNNKGERVTSTVQLSKQYLVACVSGECTPGSLMIVDEANIFGEIVNLGTIK